MTGPLLGRVRRHKSALALSLTAPAFVFSFTASAYCFRLLITALAYYSRLLLSPAALAHCPLLSLTALACCSRLLLSLAALACCSRLLLSPTAATFCPRFKNKNSTAKKKKLFAPRCPPPLTRMSTAAAHIDQSNASNHNSDLSSQVVIVHGHTPRREKRHSRGFVDDRSEAVVGAEGNIMTSAAGWGVERWGRKGVGGGVSGRMGARRDGTSGLIGTKKPDTIGGGVLAPCLAVGV